MPGTSGKVLLQPRCPRGAGFLRAAKTYIVSSKRQICPRLYLSDFAALQESACGPSRHFAAMQQSVAYRGKADID
jgi:hypothetical protein